MSNDYSQTPPGMWAGFYGRLPDLKVYTPRMGMVNGMELTVLDEREYASPEEARAAGKLAAWARYEEWQAKAPEKSMSRFICDEALAEMARQEAAAHAPVDGPARENT